MRWRLLLPAKLLGVALALLADSLAAATLRVEVEPRFAGAPLPFDAAIPGARVSVSRLDFLVSGVRLRRPDGTWSGPREWAGFVSAREGRTSLTIPGVPAGAYDRIAFRVGVPPELNHRDPATVPAGHALHPLVNNLHWGNDAGYVFLAAEGSVREAGGIARGWSWHLATDAQLMSVELPAALEIPARGGAVEMRLAFNADALIAAAAEGPSSTHSRPGDALADRLRGEVERAFAVLAVRAGEAPVTPTTAAAMPLIAPDATPYPLSFPAYFPRPDLPADNPLTREGVELGQRLFFDPALSGNGRQSCASCHHPPFAFSDAGRAVSRGANGTLGRRNAPALVNLAWSAAFFWDGRARTLREQVLQPIEDPTEMGARLPDVIARLKADGANRTGGTKGAPGTADMIRPHPSHEPYSSHFERAFGSPEITPDRLARALEQFLLVQVSAGSKFDRALRGEATFTPDEQRGRDLFHTEFDPARGQFGADCFHCHGGPLFRSQSFANNGLDGAEPGDLGRFLATGRAGDRGKFAVPSLRNVALTAPYMHDGRFATLEEAVAHYARGVRRSPTLDPNLSKHPDGGVPLSAEDQRALVAFLRTLSDDSTPPPRPPFPPPPHAPPPPPPPRFSLR